MLNKWNLQNNTNLRNGIIGGGHGIELSIGLGVKQAWVGILASPLHLYIHSFLHSANKYVLDIVL